MSLSKSVAMFSPSTSNPFGKPKPTKSYPSSKAKSKTKAEAPISKPQRMECWQCKTWTPGHVLVSGFQPSLNSNAETVPMSKIYSLFFQSVTPAETVYLCRDCSQKVIKLYFEMRFGINQLIQPGTILHTEIGDPVPAIAVGQQQQPCPSPSPKLPETDTIKHEEFADFETLNHEDNESMSGFEGEPMDVAEIDFPDVKPWKEDEEIPGLESESIPQIKIPSSSTSPEPHSVKSDELQHVTTRSTIFEKVSIAPSLQRIKRRLRSNVLKLQPQSEAESVLSYNVSPDFGALNYRDGDSEGETPEPNEDVHVKPILPNHVGHEPEPIPSSPLASSSATSASDSAPATPIPKLPKLCFTGPCSRSNCTKMFDKTMLADLLLHLRDFHDDDEYFGRGTFKIWCSFCKELLPFGKPNSAPRVESHFEEHWDFEDLNSSKPKVYTSCGLELETSIRWVKRPSQTPLYTLQEEPDVRFQKVDTKCPFPGCNEVLQSFSTKLAKAKIMRQHMETCHGREPEFPCDICGKPELDKIALFHHRKLHLSWEEKQELFGHLLPKKTTGPSPKEICSVCGILISSNSYLVKSHMKKHRPEFPCKASQCQFTSTNPDELRTHVKEKHDPSKYYSLFCTRCPEGFSTRLELKTHNLICCDPNERPFPCDLCPKRFKLKPALPFHYISAHKLSPEEAREKVYPGRGVPEWITNSRNPRIYKKNASKSPNRKKKKNSSSS